MTIGNPCQACPVRRLSLCGALSDNELNRLEEIVSDIEIAPGQSLFDEGESADYRYNVTSGCLKIYKLLPDGRRQIIGFLFSGDFVGLALSDTYAYSAESVATSRLCRFPRRKLDLLIDRHPAMERRLLGLASNELAVAQEQMLLLGRKTARERVASLLLGFSRRAAQRGEAADPIALPMTRADLADHLGLTTETVSRVFTQFKTKGLIRLRAGGWVEVTDGTALEALADGL